MHPRSILAFALAAVPAPAIAQGVVYTWPAPGIPAAAYAGDVDQDGHGDVLVVAMGQYPYLSPGSVTVRSFHLGADLGTVFGAHASDGFGRAARSLGDVDHDGSSDFVVAAPFSVATSPAYVRAYSGATGAVLWERTAAAATSFFGLSLAAIGDLDHDGIDDVVIGAPGADSTTPGSVLVVSAVTGATIRDFSTTPGATQGFGEVVARAHDLDQDGVEDVLVEDFNAQPSLRVRVLSGANGSVLRAFAEPPLATYFGTSLVALSDADGDGVADYAIGARSEWYPNNIGSGRVRLYSGATGALLWQIQGAFNQSQFGRALDRMSDLDGDGYEDILLAGGLYRISFNTYTAAEVRLISSATGATLAIGPGQSQNVTTIPDANGDGVDDYLLPNVPSIQGPPRGGLAITGYTLPAPVVGCAAKVTSSGCTPRLDVSGSSSLTLGDDLRLAAIATRPNALGYFVWGTSSASIPFGGGTLCIASPLRRLPSVQSTVSPYNCGLSGQSGIMNTTVTKPALAAFGVPAGGTFYVQAWFRDAGFPAPNNIGLSGASAVVVWP